MGKICGIYKIISPTGRVYIGQSRNINDRITHYKNLKCSGQIKLYRSLLKYGWDSHKFTIIRKCSIKNLNKFEIYYIKKYKANSKFNLNCTSGGLSFTHSKQTKLKMSSSKLGTRRSKKVCKILSLSKKGILNPMYGKKLSKIHRKRICISGKGIIRFSKITIDINTKIEYKSLKLACRRFHYVYTTIRKEFSVNGGYSRNLRYK